MNIYYYVSGHGFGHISRSSVIIKELLADIRLSSLHLVSERISFLKQEHPKLKKRTLSLDAGVVQKDSLSLDVEATKFALQNLDALVPDLLKGEAKYCKDNGIDLIVTDSSSLAITIALEANIPSVFIGNFTWDFVYANFSKYDSYFEKRALEMQVEYSFASLALLLPFFCPMPEFLEVQKLGLVGRFPQLTKSEARKKFGFTPDKQYVLLSFGAYGLKEFNIQWENLPKSIIPVAEGMPELENQCLYLPPSIYYPDLVCACDAVLTKPGYGILSECYLAKTPILYTDRGDFAEYPTLVKALDDYFPSAYLSQDQVSKGNWDLDQIAWKGTENWNQLALNGEKEAVQSIFDL